MRAIGDLKVCSRCRRELLVGRFFHNRATADGFADYCKDCFKEIPSQKRSVRKRVAKNYRAGKLPGWMYS